MQQGELESILDIEDERRLLIFESFSSNASPSRHSDSSKLLSWGLNSELIPRDSINPNAMTELRNSFPEREIYSQLEIRLDDNSN